MKKLFAILLAVLMLQGLAACGANAMSDAKEAYYVGETTPAEAGFGYSYRTGSNGNEAIPAATDSSAPADNAGSSQKLIRKIRLSVETDDYYAFLEDFTGKIAALGGYIEDMEASTSGSYPYATIVVRVPANQLSALTDSVAGIGNITYKHESQQDVTLQYVDTESRITALKAEQTRLLELLEQAGDLSEVLQIEDRLTEVRYQLEAHERSLRALANQVEYATATVEVSQVRVFTPAEKPGFWENIGNGLSSSARGLWEILKDVFSFLVINLPYLLVFVGLPLILVIVLVKRHNRKQKARRKAAPRQAQAAAWQPQQPVPPQSLAQSPAAPENTEPRP